MPRYELIEQGRHQPVLDIAHVDFCDSTGLALFTELRHRLARHGWLRLATPDLGPVVLALSAVQRREGAGQP
jgi:anti-anti-sigma regulatory factor